MSEQATIEILDAPGRLVELTPVEQGLAELRKDLAGVQFDVSTTKGEKAAREARSRCVAIRTGADKAYEAWNKPMLERQRSMRGEVARIKEEVTEIEQPIDAQIKAQEAKAEAQKEAKREAERQRLQKIQNAIEGLRAHAAAAVGKSPADVRAIIDGLTAREITLDEFADHTGNAELVKAETLGKLDDVLAAAEAQEAEQARLKAEREELGKLRAQQEERERMAAAKAAEEAQAAAAARAAEDARIQAQRDLLALEQRAAQQARDQAEADARAVQEAAAKKLADERAAFEAEKAAEAKRQQDAFDAEEKRIADAAAAAQKLIDDAAAAEGKRVQDAAEERARVALREAQAREQAEARQRAAREAADTQLRNAAEQMLEALRMWKRADESGNADELEAARHERDAAIDIATNSDFQEIHSN